ncbi:barstar family protein [Actinoplanes sp. DH11]|uniref:barstar family protein n=1 Tax=Actinoplanes sp. DH11 TaxID=2857011 RepID=UPI001E3BF7B9|nr:barstar family protein [Actinoplanes sp. DH11]
MATEVTRLREREGTVVRLAGRELRNPASLFAVFARELSFPGYFGHNWDALVDCLHDWHGHETAGQGLAVLIDDSDHLAEADFLGVFFSVLCEAGWKANLQLDADGVPHESWSPFPLHFVFLLTEVAPSAFAQGAASGADVDVGLVDGRLVATLAGIEWPGSAPVTP